MPTFVTEKPSKPIWFSNGSWWGIGHTAGTWVVYQRDAADTWTSASSTLTSTVTAVDVAIDSDGSVVWYGWHASTPQMGRITYNGGTDSWDITTAATSVPAIGSRAGHLSIDGSGRVWGFADGSGEIRYFVRDTDLTALQGDTLLTSDPPATPDHLSKSVAWDGKVGVIWDNQTTQRMRFVYRNDADALTTWQSEEDASSATANYADNHADIVVGANGTELLAVWKTNLAGTTDDNIVYARRNSSGTWVDETVVATRFGVENGNEFTRPRIVYDETHDRVLIVANRTYNPAPPHIFVSPVASPSFGAPYPMIARDVSDPVVPKVPVNATSGILTVGMDPAGAARDGYFSLGPLQTPGYDYYVYSTTGDNSAAWASDYTAAGSPGTVDVLVVGGGGGGGQAGSAGGGGGAGGLIWKTGVSVTGSETVTVGAGGAGRLDAQGSGSGLPGADSVFGSDTAVGGGYGGATAGTDGGAGGSGGGGAGSSTAGSGGAGTAGQGNAGGAGNTNAVAWAAGGGGGSGAAGESATASAGAAGGVGTDLSAELGTGVGTFGWFAAGGAGADEAELGGSVGGIGGGGQGGTGETATYDHVNGAPGVDGTGSGGGGGSDLSDGQDGGDGIVIVRVATTVDTLFNSVLDIVNSKTDGFVLRPRPSTTFQDTAGTNPVTADGQSVQRIEDQSVHGHDFITGTNANTDPPTYSTTGARHWLNFPTSPDLSAEGYGLESVDAMGTAMNGNPYTVSAGVRFYDVDFGQQFFFCTNTTNTADESFSVVHIGANTATQGLLSHWTTNGTFAYTFANNVDEVHTAEFTVPGGNYWIDGTNEYTSGTVPSQLDEVDKMGIFVRERYSGYSTPEHCAGRLYAMAAVINDTLTAGERATIEQWIDAETKGPGVTGTGALQAERATGYAYVWYGDVPDQQQSRYIEILNGVPQVSDPSNAYDAPDGVYTTDSGDVSYTTYWEMYHPSVAGSEWTNNHTFRLYLRPAPDGSNPPTLDYLELQDDLSGPSVVILNAATSITASGTYDFDFDPTPLANFSGPRLIVTQTVSASGGNPNTRETVQIDAIEWIVRYRGEPPVFGGARAKAQRATVSGAGTVSNDFKSGSGALAAQQATLSGAGTREVKFTGILAAQQATLAGVASLTREASGALTAQQATVDGTAAIIKEGPGVLVAQQATVSGTAVRTITGTGALAAQQATLTGTAERAANAAGTLAAQQATLTGAGTRGLSGSGALVAQQATLTGTSESIKEGTGALAAQQATLTGAGTRTITGAGVLAAQQAALDGIADRIITTAPALAAQQATLDGAGFLTRKISATLAAQQATLDGAGGTGGVAVGSMVAQPATLTGAGTRTVLGSGTLAAQQAVLDGQGTAIPQNKTGEGVLVAQQATLDGAGVIVKTATGALQAAGAVVAGVGSSGFLAEGTLTAQQATLAGTASRVVTATGALNSQQATLDGAGVRTLETTPTLAAQQAVVAGAGTRVFTATGALAAQAAAVAGAGDVIPLTRFATGELAAAPASLNAQILRTVKGSGTMNANQATVDAYPWVELHTADAVWTEQKTDWGKDIG